MAKELGVHYSTVRDWVKEYKKDGLNSFPGSGNLKPEDDEIRRLRRELDNLKEKIVGWSTADNMKTSLCIKALKNAIKRYRPAPGLIHHSDRGIQYCSSEYQKFLKTNKIICSMSRKGNCYDNVCAETFFSTIKCELLYQREYKTREEARRDIFWYIEIYYNNQRRNQFFEKSSESEANFEEED